MYLTLLWLLIYFSSSFDSRFTVVVLHATLRRRRGVEVPAVKADLTAGMPGIPLTPTLMVVLMRAFGVPLDRFLLGLWAHPPFSRLRAWLMSSRPTYCRNSISHIVNVVVLSRQVSNTKNLFSQFTQFMPLAVRDLNFFFWGGPNEIFKNFLL